MRLRSDESGVVGLLVIVLLLLIAMTAAGFALLPGGAPVSASYRAGGVSLLLFGMLAVLAAVKARTWPPAMRLLTLLVAIVMLGMGAIWLMA